MVSSGCMQPISTAANCIYGIVQQEPSPFQIANEILAHTGAVEHDYELAGKGRKSGVRLVDA